MTEVHQFVQSFVDHDAISSHVRHLQRLLTSMGIKNDVYAGEWRGENSKARYFRDYNGSPDDIVMYHLSTASPIADFLGERHARLELNYHNITPYEYLAPWEPLIAPELEVARRQLGALATRTELGIGVSLYNEIELRNAGCRKTAVAPIMFDQEEFNVPPDARVDAQLKRAKFAGGSDWLFVGRLTPHKCQHEIIRAFDIYRRLYDGKARLHLVGGISSHRYLTSLRKYAELLELTEVVNITESVSSAALNSYYRNADVFVCLSEHEGFGVPVLEAMQNDVPVIAFDSSAVGETVGNGGLVLQEKSAATVAVAVHRVLSDDVLIKELASSGRARLADFTLAKSEARWREVIEQLVAS